MYSEKYEGDVVFINDKDLGISNTRSQQDRPCIILHFDGYDYYVIHMTTKRGSDEDPNRDQFRILCGSYVKLNSSVKKFDKNFIGYSDVPNYENAHKYEFTDDEFNYIYNNYKHMWD